MKTKILMLVMVFAWALCGAGDVHAEGFEGLDDIPSTGEFVMMGAVAAIVIGFVVLAIVSSGNDEEAGEQEEFNLSGIDEPAPSVRIDPVLALGRDTVGAGMAFSF